MENKTIATVECPVPSTNFVEGMCEQCSYKKGRTEEQQYCRIVVQNGFENCCGHVDARTAAEAAKRDGYSADSYVPSCSDFSGACGPEQLNCGCDRHPAPPGR